MIKFFLVSMLVAAAILLLTSPSSADMLPAPAVSAPAAICTVTSTADAGPGTLRQCLLSAANRDTITFSPAVFPPGNPMTIALTSALPAITQGNLTIDASNAGVILDGSGTPAGTSGLDITSSGNTIRGLQILYFTGNGISIYGSAQNNTIGGNRTIGNGPMGQGNLITGNAGNGVTIEGAGTMSNTVRGNLIGLDLDGTMDLMVQTLAVSPAYANDRTVFIGTRFHKAWKTTDGGSTWTALGNGLTITRVLALAVSPNYATDQTVFAGTISGGIFKSSDGGANWAQVYGGLAWAEVRVLVLSPDYANDQTVFAGTTEGVLASTDGGNVWETRNSGLTSTRIKALAVSPNYSADQTLFVGTAKAEVFILQTG